MTRGARDVGDLGSDGIDPTAARKPCRIAEAALTGDIRGLRIAVPREWFFDGADDIVITAFEVQMNVEGPRRDGGLRRLSARCAPSAPMSPWSAVEGATIHANWMREHPGDYAIHLSGRLFGGYAIPGTYYLERAVAPWPAAAAILPGSPLPATTSSRRQRCACAC